MRAPLHLRVAVFLLLSIVFPAAARAGSPWQDRTLVIVVMDPLAAPLACACVQGYAQRKYEQLGTYLEKRLDCRVEVHWSESLRTALREKTKGRADLVIGKQSVVLADAAQVGRKLAPVARLTGNDGTTTQTGLFVVRSDDPATTVADLKGYRILFGPDDCEEKSAAAKSLLKQLSIPLPKPSESCEACSVAVTKLLELPAGSRAAAIISSYARPLLEGCGTVPRGALRVIGITDPVPFVTAFVPNELPRDRRAALRAALLATGTQPSLLKALETRRGFVAATNPRKKKSK